MYTISLLFSSLFALMAAAKPININLIERSSASSGSDTFNIEISNNCSSTKHFGIYQVTSSFQMNQMSDPVVIGQNQTQNISAPYKDIGMRLSGHAEWGTSGQWASQALFEFGYSEYNDLAGTAYDLSIMEGSDSDVGLAVYPILSDGVDSDDCPSKICLPGNCNSTQGWTNADQVSDGSPADTVCYHGKMNFKVVFCP